MDCFGVTAQRTLLIKPSDVLRREVGRDQGSAHLTSYTILWKESGLLLFAYFNLITFKLGEILN